MSTGAGRFIFRSEGDSFQGSQRYDSCREARFTPAKLSLWQEHGAQKQVEVFFLLPRLARHKLERIPPADNAADGRGGKMCRAYEGSGVAYTIEEFSPRLAGLPRVVIYHHA
jgi:hypothetical protein